MEKKIGILTFHNCVNYGAVMQAYGLQSFLESKGYDVEIVDYVNEKIDSELNAKIEVYKDSDYVYCHKIKKDSLGCLSDEYKNSITGEYVIDTCVWSR